MFITSHGYRRGLNGSSGLRPRSGDEGTVVPIQVFADESGGKGHSAVFVFVGLIGPTDMWAAFSGDWRAFLDEPRKLSMFKMREAVSRTGAFNTFSETERDDKVLGLARIINKHAPRAIFSALNIDDLEDVYARLETHRHFTQPYFWPFHVLILGICYDLLDFDINEPFEIIFDRHDIFGPRAKRFWPLVRASTELMCPEIAHLLPVEPLFRTDDECLPLQAADLFAWSTRNALSGLPPGPCDFVFDEFTDVERSSHIQLLDRERMERQIEMAQNIEPDVMDAMIERFTGLHPDEG